jgi:hypothetical protein
MSSSQSADPFKILGISPDATEAAIRVRYLELVKQFPPDREPEKFREVREAFEAAKDPLPIARRMISPLNDEVPEWADVLASQKQNPPRFSVPFLLSLGNRHGDGSGARSEPD